MASKILSWNGGAVACYEAVRGRLLYDGNIYLSDLVSALAIDTLPNQSLLGRILRDTTIWPDGSSLVRAASRSAGYQDSNPHLDLRLDSFENFAGFAFAVERLAKAEGSRTVGERHIAQRLVEIDGTNYRFAFMSLNTRSVYQEVRQMEIGPEYTDEALKGWHGLVDTSIVLQSKAEFWNVNWRAVSLMPKPAPVALWLSTALLHELDEIPLYHRSDEVKFRARDFSKWLSNQLKKPEDLQHLTLGDDVRLLFWTAPLPDAPPDSQHLEAAFALQDRRVPIVVVTHDNHMKVRAFAEGLQVVDLPDDMLK
jgi:hypothetical protein